MRPAAHLQQHHSVRAVAPRQPSGGQTPDRSRRSLVCTGAPSPDPPSRSSPITIPRTRAGHGPWPCWPPAAIALTAVPTMTRVDSVATTTRILVGLASASRPGSPSPEAAWSVPLPPRARTSVQADLSGVTPVSGPLLERLAGLVSFDDQVAQCPRPPCRAPPPVPVLTVAGGFIWTRRRPPSPTRRTGSSSITRSGTRRGDCCSVQRAVVPSRPRSTARSAAARASMTRVGRARCSRRCSPTSSPAMSAGSGSP